MQRGRICGEHLAEAVLHLHCSGSGGCLSGLRLCLYHQWVGQLADQRRGLSSGLGGPNQTCCGWCRNWQSQVSQNDSLLQQLLGSGRYGFLRLSLLAFDLLVLDRVEVDLAHPIHHVLVLERHEPETAMTFRLLIHQHDRFVDLAELAEILSDLFGRCILRDASHENLLRFVRLSFRAVLRRGVLGIDFLSIQSVDWHFENFVYAIWFLECDESKSPTPLQKAIIIGLVSYILVINFLYHLPE